MYRVTVPKIRYYHYDCTLCIYYVERPAKTEDVLVLNLLDIL